MSKTIYVVTAPSGYWEYVCHAQVTAKNICWNEYGKHGVKGYTVEEWTAQKKTSDGSLQMADRTTLQKLIDQVDHRIEYSSKMHRNTDDWLDSDVNDGGVFLGTYQEWIEQAFAELHDEAAKIKQTQEDRRFSNALVFLQQAINELHGVNGSYVREKVAILEAEFHDLSQKKEPTS